MKSDDTWSHQVKTYAATILFAQVKFIPSEKFLDDLTNPYSLGVFYLDVMSSFISKRIWIGKII